MQAEQAAKERQEWQQRAEALQASADLLQQTQADLADSNGLVAQQASVIQQLERQLLQSGGLGGPGSDQRTQQLEADNAALRQALQAAQQQASQARLGARSSGSGCSGDNETQLAELQGKFARLQAQLRAREEQHERQLRMLKQEHQRLRIEEGIRWV